MNRSQWISILGDRFTYKGGGIDLRFVGRAAEPITSKQSRGNRFRITLRDLDRREAGELDGPTERVARHGFANYFDDQRFGSIKHGQGFPMRDVDPFWVALWRRRHQRSKILPVSTRLT